MSSLKSVLAVTGLALLLSACGGESTEQLPNTSQNSGTVSYNGPAPATDDVANFKRTVWDNLELALKAPRGPFATLFHVISGGEKKRVEYLLDLIRLGSKRSELAANLSHGQKQWLEIGMLLAQDPKLLLVDEPAAGMTDAETAETAELLKDIANDHSVVVVEHDMVFVRSLGVKVTVLHEGSVLAEGSLDHVSADERVVEVYLGR